jgi:hypothetical protein
MTEAAPPSADPFEADKFKPLRDLLFMARTTGGTAGPDADLMGACERAEQLLIALNADRADPPLPGDVPVGRTQDEIKARLRVAGADQIAMFESSERSAVAFRLSASFYRITVPTDPAAKNPQQDEHACMRDDGPCSWVEPDLCSNPDCVATPLEDSTDEVPPAGPLAPMLTDQFAQDLRAAASTNS